MYSISEYTGTYMCHTLSMNKKQLPFARHLSDLAKHIMCYLAYFFMLTRASREGFVPITAVDTMVLVS